MNNDLFNKITIDIRFSMSVNLHTHIYQVLGAQYRKVKFSVYDRIYSAKLSSEALYRHCKNKLNSPSVKIHLIYPMSLALKRAVKISDLLSEEFIDKVVLEKIEENILGENVRRDVDILFINSFGTYMLGGTKERKVHLECAPGTIILQILFDMIKRINVNKSEVKVIADISTGYNVYNVALLNALRALIVRNKLNNAFEGNIRAYYAVSEPILGRVEAEKYKVYIDEYDVKAFFELPIRERNLDNISKLENYINGGLTPERKRTYAQQNLEINRKLKSLLFNLIRAFNAIKYNTPLALYYPEILNLNLNYKQIEKDIMNFYQKTFKMKTHNNTLKSLKHNDKRIINILYSIALYEGITKLLSKLEKPTLNEIKEAFPKIYSKLKLDLNTKFLKRDIREIKSYSEKISNKWKVYDKIKHGEKQDRPIKSKKITSDIKRNFFAHSGFEETILEIRKNKQIELRYRKDKINEIKKWLLNP